MLCSNMHIRHYFVTLLQSGQSSSGFLGSLDTASSGFLGSLDIASSGFLGSLDIASSVTH